MYVASTGHALCLAQRYAGLTNTAIARIAQVSTTSIYRWKRNGGAGMRGECVVRLQRGLPGFSVLLRRIPV